MAGWVVPLSESFMNGAFDRSDGEHRPGVLRYPALQRIEGKEASMTSLFRHACLAVLLTATAAPASAQTWVWEPDRPRYYEPEARSPHYDRYYGWDARARVYEPEARVVNTPPLALTPTQRTTIYRTIIPQGRGRGPIVRERIVTETVAPAPVLQERVVREPVVAADYVVGSRVTDAYALAPLPRAVVETVPSVRSYRYMVINNRLLLVDPVTMVVVADVTN
jgi:hypothetical protein